MLELTKLVEAAYTGMRDMTIHTQIQRNLDAEQTNVAVA